jgi:GTP cyclohydrolase I
MTEEIKYTNQSNQSESLSAQAPEADPQELLTVSSSSSITTSGAVPTNIDAQCQRATGEVCICDTCEVTRTRKHLLRSNKRTREEAVTVAAFDSHSPPKKSKAPEKAAALDVNNSGEDKLQTMSAACKTILECIGEDPHREGLLKTPLRWAKALLYMCQGYDKRPEDVTNGAVFHENHSEMVVVRNIDIHSLCEHHMVPFTGRVHIGYIPNGKILGLSKLARIAELYARRLQVQERLTRQIADAIVETVEPLGVAVVVECTHFCMVMRGVQKTGALTTTSSVRGCFESNSKTRAEFFSIIQGNGVTMC